MPGVRPGTRLDRSAVPKDFGYPAVDVPISVHDFHATLLHLMDIDHERLTSTTTGPVAA